MGAENNGDAPRSEAAPAEAAVRDGSPSETADASPIAEQNLAADTSMLGRWAAVLGFVGLWMAAGWLLRLDANTYLLLGVPLTAAFQIFVRRQPLRALWVRDAPPFRIDLPYLLIAAALAILPLWDITHIGMRGGPVIFLWNLCAVLGAPAGAYAIRNYSKAAGIRPFTTPLPAILLLSALMAAGVVSKMGWGVFDLSDIVTMLRWSLLYFAVGFLLEEVTFRGALDSHLHSPQEGPGQTERGHGSAMLQSFLWGIWHLPITAQQPETASSGIFLTAIRLGFLHLLIGYPLTLARRRSGNLAPPVAAHALLDGIRNALLR